MSGPPSEDVIRGEGAEWMQLHALDTYVYPGPSYNRVEE